MQGYIFEHISSADTKVRSRGLPSNKELFQYFEQADDKAT